MIDAYDKPARTMLTSEGGFSRTTHIVKDKKTGRIAKLHKALVQNGTLYFSFKYGEGFKQRGDRTFTDFTENSVNLLLCDAGFEILECGVTSDIRPDRADEKWVNVIARKND